MTSMSSKRMVAEAGAATPHVSPEEAARLLGNPDAQLVDVRDQAELDRTGAIAGAIHAPRGLLEFKADPESPTHLPELSSGKRLVLFCASGGRAALAAQTLQGMGVPRVEHVQGGGFEAIKAAGASTA